MLVVDPRCWLPSVAPLFRPETRPRWRCSLVLRLWLNRGLGWCVLRYGYGGLTDRDIAVAVWVQIRKRDRGELASRLLCPDIEQGLARTTRRGIPTWLWIRGKLGSEHETSYVLLLVHPEVRANLGGMDPLSNSAKGTTQSLERSSRP